MLRPFIIIRFGVLRGDRIGHFAGNTEIYLCERDAGKHLKNTYDIFYISNPICNYQLEKMWKRTIPISKYVEYLNRANLCIPGNKIHQIHSSSDRDIHDLLVKTSPHLKFTEEEERIGKNALKAMGVPDDMPFFCFIGRDPAYLEDYYPGKNMDYHDYRNMEIKNYVSAVKALIQRDYFGIRMGYKVQEPLHIENEKYVDYATKYRTDFLDIYLCAKCRFFMNSMSGIDAVPAAVFRRPTVMVNYVPMAYVHGSRKNSLFIFKKLWLIQEHRFLTFPEIIQSGIGRFLKSEQYEKAGIELIENTPEEITAVALEMDERLKGIWQTTEEDEELQRRFWTLFKPNDLNSVFHTRIGKEFLRQNQNLL